MIADRRFFSRRRLAQAAWCCAVLSTVAVADAEPFERVSFTHDVMQTLSKAGCNLGTCHGNANGKGGFKLSLRGQDPAADYAALVREQFGRRVDRERPEQSLILLKATMRQAHEGGRRFTPDSNEYELLRTWIAAGAPNDLESAQKLVGLRVEPAEQFVVEPSDRVQIRAAATFADGTRRDVTATSVYETSNTLAAVAPGGLVTRAGFGETTVLVRYLDRQLPVRLAFVPARPEFVWPDVRPHNYVDEHVFAKLRSLRLMPAPPCDDTTFVRRAYLDLLGLLPTADEARQFVRDPDPAKRAKLVDQLLDRPEFADHWALKFSDLLHNEEKTLDRKGVQNFHAWIRRWIEQDRPLDELAAELAAARGGTYTSPAANYYRAQRDAVTRAETTAQVFLGVRLQCAKCHNHPFDRWTQTDYYRWVNLFARVEYRVLDNARRDKNDKHEFDGAQIVWLRRSGDFDDPRTGAPQAPRMLGAQDDLPPNADRLESLAAWLADDANPFFAQVQANRIWFHLMGRGIVEPIDDFRATNPPSHPALLAALGRDFAAGGMRLKPLVRTIMGSQTYQLAAASEAGNAADEATFSRAQLRPLAAEPLLDALSQVTGASVKFNGYPLGIRAGQIPGVRAVRDRDEPPSAGDLFLSKFGKPPRLLSCECERSTDVTLGQAFQLISGPTIDQLLTADDNRLSKLLESGQSTAAMIDDLVWTALSRPPTAEESASLAAYFDRAADKRRALEDITWSLVNSKEFLLRR